MFTDKNGRTILAFAQVQQHAHDALGSLRADEILLHLLSKVPAEEFIRAPALLQLSGRQVEMVNARGFEERPKDRVREHE